MATQAAAAASPSFLNKLAAQGPRQGEKVVPLVAAEEAEEMAWARVAELEAELIESKHRVQLKELREDENCLAQQQLVRLERAMAKNTMDSKQEKDRSSRVTDLVQQQLAGAEEKVGKLILAVAAAKHRAETAEMAIDKVAEQARAEWADAVRQLQKRVAEEELCRHEAEERARELEQQNAALRQQLLGMQGSKDSAHSASNVRLDADVDKMVRDLQQQVTDELNKRMSVQNKLLEKDRQLQAAEAKLSGAQPDVAVAADLESRLAAKDLELVQLQQQLGEEIEKRLQIVEQVAETERKLSDSHIAKEGDDAMRHDNLQQVIRKEREVCNLQDQLAGELHQRRAVQQQLLEKEHTVCELQKQLIAAVSRKETCKPAKAVQYHEVDLTIFRKDGEEEPDMEQSPLGPPRDMWHSLSSPPPPAAPMQKKSSQSRGARTPTGASSPPAPRPPRHSTGGKWPGSPEAGPGGKQVARSAVGMSAQAAPGTVFTWPATEWMSRNSSTDCCAAEHVTPVSLPVGGGKELGAGDGTARRRSPHSARPPVSNASAEPAGVPNLAGLGGVALMQQGVALMSARAQAFATGPGGSDAMHGYPRHPTSTQRGGSVRLTGTRRIAAVPI